MSLTITHPDPTPGLVEVSGLTFTDGVAEVPSLDDAARAVLTDHGFTIDGENDVPESDEERAAREAAEAEAARQAAEAEAQRLAEEEAQRQAAEAQRQAEEAAKAAEAEKAKAKK